MKNTSISRQLIITMGILNLAITFCAVVFSCGVYTLALKYQWISLNDLDTDSVSLHMIDMVWIMIVLCTGFIISTMLSFPFAKRLIDPMNALAEAVSKIRLGDLSARAEKTHNSSTEIDKLIEDFNLMAEKLEISVKNAHIWNASIAHELRTPITILQGRLQGIIDGVFQADMTLYKNLLHQVEGLSHLVEDLRTLTLLENQQLRLNLEKTNLKSSIEKCLNAFHGRLVSAGLNVQTDFTYQSCFCDCRRMEQVLLALLDNEVRYANSGNLYIKTEVNAKTWILHLEDDGPGISEEHINYLFKPFYRLESSRNRTQGGTGLGLAVVYAIVAAHHGTIKYHITQGTGSRFSIYLPLLDN
ncbi:two-component sensor histidine kinase AdeS [Acinetobacter qingfengensis]|uniref:histidine kinase n=1 Tax=Acinetobacter qingfengensis TaxID=1262585 RepID=A0A1E7R3Z3_9GAMM|nr:two-component sensor histidine kinase AdeS [Acinetobacter qingfengensis]KAA8731467.1 two-component sensor histidine kinase AdeS [Acinetobacter qingfengensis]OEY94024.1 two-component sensor histidine kinase AdeS [Acinetobacter qingfengensis]